MKKGVIYLTSSSIVGVIKIGKTETINFKKRMDLLERNGYSNINGLKKEFAIEVDDYEEKERLLHKIFDKSRIANTEFFAIDIDLAKQLLSSFDGKIIYPKESKNIIFDGATDAVKEKEELSLNRHHFKEIVFTSSLTCKEYKGKTSESGTLSIIDLETNKEVPNYSKPSKKEIIRQAIIDLGEKPPRINTTYTFYRELSKLIKEKK